MSTDMSSDETPPPPPPPLPAACPAYTPYLPSPLSSTPSGTSSPVADTPLSFSPVTFAAPSIKTRLPLVAMGTTSHLQLPSFGMSAYMDDSDDSDGMRSSSPSPPPPTEPPPLPPVRVPMRPPPQTTILPPSAMACTPDSADAVATEPVPSNLFSATAAPSFTSTDTSFTAVAPCPSTKPGAVPDFSLSAALSLVRVDTPALAARLEAQEADLLWTRGAMISLSRRNFMLERELNEIDEKIKLLIKNRLTLQEVMAASSSASAPQTASEEHVALAALKNKKTLYEDLFFLLQSTPHYFALLARVMQPSKDGVQLFVQTVVLDTFGDAFDTHEERLLLSLFREALQAEMAECSDRATLLRSNSAITQMLSAYAKRGAGLGVLREILEEPLRDLCDSKAGRAVNLELQPLKAYHQIIQDFETQTGNISDMDKSVATDEEAATHPAVQALLAERVALLAHHAETILSRITASATRIPYGMRWICRVIGELYQARFGGDAAEESAGASSRTSLAEQIQALQGGFIYLRFFNPAIVAPDATGFITSKPSRTVRRNLVLIAKLLQNLSNGLPFGDKEAYMKPLNPWLQSHRPHMERFFEQLTQVDDVDDSLSLDRYTHSSLGGGSRLNEITLSLNQIFFMQSLLQEYKEQICLGAQGTYSATEPLAVLLNKFGSAVPAQVPRADNVTVVLRLVDTRSARLSTTTAPVFATTGASDDAVVHDPFGRNAATRDPRLNPLYLQAKSLLLNVLKRLPEPSTAHRTLLAYLAEQRRTSIVSGNHSLHDAVNNVSAMLSTLYNMRLLSQATAGLVVQSAATDEKERCYDAFLYACTSDARHRQAQLAALEKQSSKIATALATVTTHHEYLKSRLELYQLYLANVKHGQAQAEETSTTTKKGKSKPPDVFSRTMSYTHAELTQMNLIHSIDGDYSDKILKHLHYVIEMRTETSRHLAPRFFLSVTLKKGVSIPILAQPVEIVLEDLLQLQEHGEPYMRVEEVELNVNVLVHFLNTQFIAQIRHMKS